MREILHLEATEKSLLNMFNGFTKYILIFGLTGGGIINVLLLYFGLHGTIFREKIFIFVSVVIFCIACLLLIQMFMTMNEYRPQIIIALIYPIFAILIFVASFAIFGESAYRNKDMLFQFGCFCIPAFIFGLDCMLNRRESALFLCLDVLSIFYVPIAVLCLYRFGSSIDLTGRLEAIGDLNYMSVAYILLVPIAFLIISTVFRNSSFLSKSHNRVNKLMFISLALLLWGAILSTGTRGVLLSVLGLLVFLILWTTYVKQKLFIMRSIMLFFLFLIMFLIFMHISPDSTESASYRTKYFVEGLLRGKFQTSTTQAVSQVELEIINSMPAVPKATNTIKQNNVSEETVNNNALDPLNVVMNREELFKAAWGEFVKSPIFGLGPLGFNVKYGRYVHNIVMEVLCDYGIIGLLAIISIIINRIIRLLKLNRKNETTNIIIPLLFCLNIPLLISSSIFLWPPLWFLLGYTSRIKNNEYKELATL